MFVFDIDTNSMIFHLNLDREFLHICHIDVLI